MASLSLWLAHCRGALPVLAVVARSQEASAAGQQAAHLHRLLLKAGQPACRYVKRHCWRAQDGMLLGVQAAIPRSSQTQSQRHALVLRDDSFDARADEEVVPYSFGNVSI